MNELLQKAKYKLLDILFTVDDIYDYVEWVDDEAQELLYSFATNYRFVISNTLNKIIYLNGEAYTPTNYRIHRCETDAIIEFMDGSIDFDGAVDFKEKEDAFMLRISIRNFKIYEIWASDMESEAEIAIINDGYIVRKMNREFIKTGPRTSSAKDGYTYGDRV